MPPTRPRLTPAIADVRRAVRVALERVEGTAPLVLVALSGGPDSLALAAATAFEASRAGIRAGAVIVDHGLQPGSADAATAAARQASALGLTPVLQKLVTVGEAGGPEAAARTARYDALVEAAAESGASAVLLGHTLDDQAETVLLGLGRGSGARSIAGMRAFDDPWARPLLGVRRERTRAACAELGLTPWEDPHNADSRYTRVRLRTEVLPLLEEVLGGGVAGALSRTAAALREDTEALDTLAERALPDMARDDGLAAGALAALPAAVRRRVIRLWLLEQGAVDLSAIQIHGVDALVTAWRGQGGVAVGSDLPHARLFASRRDGVLTMHTEPV